ncbi:hypothetical protein SO802_021508 [Lithocarpus litseifolius]|uniref:RNase H type-1 domain-containing protein n=1 Tax=Lithocarpus litseifolius TaxID=425828 RepID=A0AAW2CFD4_9ROSI
MEENLDAFMSCKIRNFLWRACKNAIPTMTSLLHRRVVDDPSCSLCAQHNEDVLHSLWSCPNLAQDDGRAGIGVTIRDSPGSVMVSLTQNAQLSSLVVEMEALAATRGIELALELGFDRIIFKGDSNIVTRALTDQSPPFALFGLLIRDAQVFADQLSWVKFQRVRRDGNNIAHNLTRHARRVTGFSVWIEDIPFHYFDVYQQQLRWTFGPRRHRTRVLWTRFGSKEIESFGLDLV